MEVRISKRVAEISSSATEVMSTLANKLKRQGVDIISFAQGEPDFNTPDNISRAAIKAVENAHTRYTDVPGTVEIREVVRQKFKVENAIDYDVSEVMVSNGGKQILFLLFQTLCEPGDEVIVPTPSYVSYEEQIKLSGAIPVFTPTDVNNNFRITLKDVEKYLTPQTKAVIINSPNNPTGAVCEEEELRKIADLALRKNFFIVTDEVYEHLLYDGQKHFSIASINVQAKDIVITVNSASKTYAMTGWRVGYAGGPEDIISGMIKLQGHVSGNICSVSQKAAVEALKGAQDSIAKMLDFYAKRRDLMFKKINSIPEFKSNKPDGAFYMFVDVTGLYGKVWAEGMIENDLNVSEFFLKKANVAVVPGTAFRYPGYVRFVFAKSEDEIKEGLGRIKKAIKTLNVK